MSDLSPHIKEISKTLEPAYERGTPAKAIDGLSEADKDAFVAALIGELVTLKAAAKHRRIDVDGYRRPVVAAELGIDVTDYRSGTNVEGKEASE